MKRSLEHMAALSVRVPRGFDGYWSIIRALDVRGPWTINQIDAELRSQ